MTDQHNDDGVLNASGYEPLADILIQAYDQCAFQKGRDRHASEQPFDDQPMQTIQDLTGGTGFAVGQAIKKAQEAGRLDPSKARDELLGAIVYLAGAIRYLDRQHGAGDVPDQTNDVMPEQDGEGWGLIERDSEPALNPVFYTDSGKARLNPMAFPLEEGWFEWRDTVAPIADWQRKHVEVVRADGRLDQGRADKLAGWNRTPISDPAADSATPIVGVRILE